MDKVIITGADGFVGSYTVHEFLAGGCEVLALGRRQKPRRLHPHENLKYLQCDVFNVDELLNAVPHDYYDTFIHFAWEGSAGAERADYSLQMKNALNTVECLKAAKKLGCGRFVGAGSIMEYEVEAAIHTQGTRPGMGYIYSMGKHISHCMCKSVAADIGIDLVWPIITNAYGVGEVSPRFVNTTLRKVINGEPLQFTAATQNYDFVYVSDIARAFYLIAKNGKPFCEYMIGSGKARPLKEFIIEMLHECAPDAEPLFGDVPFTGVNMPISTFGISDTVKDCGYMPEISFAQGTRMTLEWLRGMGEDVQHDRME